jgi:hypothetical protein
MANYNINEVEKIDTKLDSVVERIPGIQGGRGLQFRLITSMYMLLM